MKRAIFPLLVFFFIVAALIYRLSSCTSNVDRSAAAPPAASISTVPSAGASATDSVSPSAVVSPPAAPSPKQAASPGINYTDNDIVRLYKKEGYDAVDIRDADGATIVEFSSPGPAGGSPSGFAWFDRATGAHEVVGCGLAVDKFEITPQKTLTVLTTGKNYNNGSQWFPEIYRSEFSDGAETVRYNNETSPYYMPIDKSFTLGGDRPESLRSITFDYDGVSVGFVPQPGHEQEFEAAFRFIPKTGVVTSGGSCYITFYNTTLTPNFKPPKGGTGDSLRSFVSVKCDGTNTTLTLKLGTRAERYNVTMGLSPDDGMPYAVLRFRSSDSLFPAYPKGW